MTILVLKSSKLGPSLVFNILRIELVEFPLELVLCVNRIRSFPNVVKPTMPPNKGYILKEESDIGLLLGAILHSHCPKIGSESPKEVICLPCIPSPVEGRRSWCIPLWSGGYLDRPTVGHHNHAHLELGFKRLRASILALYASTLALQAWSSPSLAVFDA